MMATVVAILDTKGRELDYPRGRLREQDVDVNPVHAGTHEPQALPDWIRG